MKKGELFELRKRVGNLNALVGVTDYVLNDGPGKGVRVLHVKNGKGLDLTVAADRGLDIPFLAFKGINMGFASKTGMRSPAFYQEEGVRGFLKQFNAGMLTTCGITYAGAPCEDAGRTLGLHGPYSNTPAGHVSALTEYEGEEAVIRLRGEVREACVFEENMVLSRTITVSTERDEVEVCDHVENQGFAETPVMLVYHVNFGYPMLDQGALVYSGAAQVTPRDEWAEKGPGSWDVMEEPEIGRAEQCYFHTDFDQPMVLLHNEKLGVAAAVTFDKAAFPLICQWKCMMAGDYALGLEPTVAGVMGRRYAREQGVMPTLKPGERMDLRFKLTFTDDPTQIASLKEMIRK